MHITPNLVNQTETKEAGETAAVMPCTKINSPRSIQTTPIGHMGGGWRTRKKCRVLVGPKEKCRKEKGRRKKMSRLVPQTRAAVLFLQKTS